MVQSGGTIVSQYDMALLQSIRLQGIRNHNSMKDIRSVCDLSVRNTMLIQIIRGLIILPDLHLATNYVM